LAIFNLKKTSATILNLVSSSKAVKITNEEKFPVGWLINDSFPHFSLGKVGLAAEQTDSTRRL